MADNLTNPDQSALTSLQRMQSSSVVGAINNGIASVTNQANKFTSWLTTPKGSRVSTTPAAENSQVPSVNFFKANADGSATYLDDQDLRVKIRVPSYYITTTTRGSASGELADLKGIIFPYTPSITLEHKADYANQNIMHSNFALHFYQRSSVSPIQITGEFTVQNEKDAAIYLSTVHLLRALTKMRTALDDDAGSPPPVCRLDAYGEYMLQNVPVVVSNFRLELPNKVDYFTIGKSSPNVIFKQASVPTLSTISVTLIPVYSRSEMQKFSVHNWLSESKTRRDGYL
jgi:hypothetical protein